MNVMWIAIETPRCSSAELQNCRIAEFQHVSSKDMVLFYKKKNGCHGCVIPMSDFEVFEKF